MKIVLPEKVKFIIETLETHGYEAYAVGEAEPYYQVSLRLMKEILAHIIPSADFKIQAFCSVLDTILSERPTGQGILIVRRERNIAQGTGALLSPNDWLRRSRLRSVACGEIM